MGRMLEFWKKICLRSGVEHSTVSAILFAADSEKPCQHLVEMDGYVSRFTAMKGELGAKAMLPISGISLLF